MHNISFGLFFVWLEWASERASEIGREDWFQCMALDFCLSHHFAGFFCVFLLWPQVHAFALVAASKHIWIYALDAGASVLRLQLNHGHTVASQILCALRFCTTYTLFAFWIFHSIPHVCFSFSCTQQFAVQLLCLNIVFDNISTTNKTSKINDTTSPRKFSC